MPHCFVNNFDYSDASFRRCLIANTAMSGMSEATCTFFYVRKAFI